VAQRDSVRNGHKHIENDRSNDLVTEHDSVRRGNGDGRSHNNRVAEYQTVHDLSVNSVATERSRCVVERDAVRNLRSDSRRRVNVVPKRDAVRDSYSRCVEDSCSVVEHDSVCDRSDDHVADDDRARVP
jgi:hypothetical protein